MTDLAPILQGFFTDRLARQKKASPNTVAAYRDTCKLLLAFARETTGKQPSQLSLADLDAPRIGVFLQHLEEQRGNGCATRNARLAAIHSLFRYTALRAPEHATVISQILAIPPRRRDRAIVSYLTSEEADVLIAAPDRTTWLGRRDHALLLLAVQTGLPVSELTGLTGLLARDAGYAAIRQLPGIGPALGAVIAAEIADITRFRAPGQLGGPDPATPRVRRQGDPRARVQAGLADAALGGDRGDPAPARRDQAAAGQGGDHRPPRRRGPQHRQDRRRPAAAHLSVLRHARRARPPRHQTGSVSAPGSPEGLAARHQGMAGQAARPFPLSLDVSQHQERRKRPFCIRQSDI